MWKLIVRTGNLQTQHKILKEGVTTVGRASQNDIVVDDAAASRMHAEIVVHSPSNTISISDQNSSNGTFVNRTRINGPTFLKDEDVVRIGQSLLTLRDAQRDTSIIKPETFAYNRELVLESLDQHAILLYDVARKLTAVTDVPGALNELQSLTQHALQAQTCLVASLADIPRLDVSNFRAGILQRALQNYAAEVSAREMCIPVIGASGLLAIICVKKDETSPAFERSDLQLGIAISHQAALTLQHIDLIQKARQQQSIHNLLSHFVPPAELDALLDEYHATGHLPELSEQKVTVLFADIEGSSGMAEKLGPKAFGELLNKFYDDATEIILKYGGVVKYLGDGVLAIFPAKSVPNCEENAVLSARELISRLNRTGALHPARRIILGVGINTGQAMLGYVGGEERAEFNVLGDVVNVAYRMQEFARPYKIIVGPATVAAINEKFKFKRVGMVNLKGREQSIQTYEVLAS